MLGVVASFLGCLATVVWFSVTSRRPRPFQFSNRTHPLWSPKDFSIAVLTTIVIATLVAALLALSVGWSLRRKRANDTHP
jgi:ABC-type antimicrobial peptide transport system permease subunit